ncbi:MAG: hypothetical protein Q8O42_17955 [Acidobacteriota bacterium]|nr:hypothetical protein [Acidobacteriota bacterium]
MNDADRSLLRELRHALLHLHKTLLDWQRAEYELDHGPMAPTQLLQVIFNDNSFAWLRPMSGLIVAIDEALVAKSPKFPAATPLVALARELVSPVAGTPYGERYQAALQEVPDAVLAHRDLITLLKLHNPAANA